MPDELRLQPLGDGSYRVLIMGRYDRRISIFVAVAKKITEEYVANATKALKEMGYAGGYEQFLRDIAVSWYAENCMKEEVPRTVFWSDDSKEQVLTKLRDVICFQRWGKTINQYPRIQKLFVKLNTGIVRDDPLGYARGMALRALISAAYGKESRPTVYFDEMRRFPQYTEELLMLLESFGITGEDVKNFDDSFYDYLTERFEAALEVLKTKKPGAEPWESWPLDENPIWQKYIHDWDDYQAWLDRKRSS